MFGLCGGISVDKSSRAEEGEEETWSGMKNEKVLSPWMKSPPSPSLPRQRQQLTVVRSFLILLATQRRQEIESEGGDNCFFARKKREAG